MNLIKGYSVKLLINYSIPACIIYLLGDEAFYQLSFTGREETSTRSRGSISTPARRVDGCLCSRPICLMLELERDTVQAQFVSNCTNHPPPPDPSGNAAANECVIKRNDDQYGWESAKAGEKVCILIFSGIILRSMAEDVFLGEGSLNLCTGIEMN